MFEWWLNKTLRVIHYIFIIYYFANCKTFLSAAASYLIKFTESQLCMSMSVQHEYKLSAICRRNIKRIVPYIGHINVRMILNCELSRERDFMIAQAKLCKINGVAFKIAKCDYDLQSLITIRRTHTHTHSHPQSAVSIHPAQFKFQTTDS